MDACACVCTTKCVTARKGYDWDSKSIKNGWQICHNFTLCFLVLSHTPTRAQTISQRIYPKNKTNHFWLLTEWMKFCGTLALSPHLFSIEMSTRSLDCEFAICVVTARFHSISEMPRIPLYFLSYWLEMCSCVLNRTSFKCHLVLFFTATGKHKHANTYTLILTKSATN